MSRIQWTKLSTFVQHFIFIFKNVLDTVKFESDFQSLRTSGMCQVFDWLVRIKAVVRLGFQTLKTLRSRECLEFLGLKFLFFFFFLLFKPHFFRKEWLEKNHPTVKAPVSGKKQHPFFDLLKSVKHVEMAKNETRPQFIPNQDLEMWLSLKRFLWWIENLFSFYFLPLERKIIVPVCI